MKYFLICLIAAFSVNAADVELKPEWKEGKSREHLDSMHGKQAPEISLGKILNTDKDLKELTKGKIVVLDFWATWCGPCIAAIPHTNEMMKKYKEKGVVIIGVCNPRGGEKMEKLAKAKGIKYPVAVDTKGTTISNFKVRSFPDYYIIGRDGKMIIADCSNRSVEEVIDAILKAEKK